MRTVFLLVLTICFSPVVCASENWDFAAAQKERCSEGGQQQMNSCLAAEYSKVDVQLNELYKKITDDLEDPSKLRKAQVAWLRFRDRDCEYANSGLGKEGSLYSFAQSACFIDHTEKRIRDLQQYLNWNCNGCPSRKPPRALTIHSIRPPVSG
ncbi:MAG: lysozyme inhibitor LprI family protein [Arenimonas sp.]